MDANKGKNRAPGRGLIDKYQRTLNYMRISITDRCNLRCSYCTPNSPIECFKHDDILRYEEILRIVRVVSRMGIGKVRVTGGEPLVRKGVYAFLELLGGIEGIGEVSLTTNGVLLKDNIHRIKDAGIKRINISLDTLNRERYREITGVDALDKVLEGIRAADDAGIAPIKINTVVLRGVNDDEIEAMAGLSMDRPYHMRFIEYMPIGDRKARVDEPLLAPEIRERLSAMGELTEVSRENNDGPAQRFRLGGAKGEIGLIRPLSHHFCGTCNRLRLTANGQLRTCLLSDRQEDLKTPLRSGCTDEELAAVIKNAARRKPMEHDLAAESSTAVGTQMSAIGG